MSGKKNVGVLTGTVLMRLVSEFLLLRFLISAVLTLVPFAAAVAQHNLEAELREQPMDMLARRARILGDPRRGAVVFSRPGLACTQCHSAGEDPRRLGPDLAGMEPPATARHIVESILDPDKRQLKGYETARVLLKSGRVITGLIRGDQPDSILFVVPGEEVLRTIAKQEVAEVLPGRSLMPAGLVNQLDDDGEFYDLVAYVLARAEAGPSSAIQLKASSALIRTAPLPDYEQQLDHSGLIRSWNRGSFNKGEKIYQRLCANCHGTKSQPGSLPHALRFGSGKFRNGHDPLSIYRTITHGYRTMLPQRRLTPREKYDVIHYIRERFLREADPSQYAEIDKSYLAGLPQGNRRGPAPSRSTPWSEMDYGPFLINTYEIPHAKSKPRFDEYAEAQRGRRQSAAGDYNFARKGIAIGLTQARGGVARDRSWVMFDHETMRLAAAWTGEGFIDWEGILINGRHRVTPRLVGQLQFANPMGPGWAEPATGSFSDPRPRGLDGRTYGPLPQDWAHFRGLYKHGQRIVLSYSVGAADVLETYGFESTTADPPIFIWTRTLSVGPESRDLRLRVAPAEGCSVAILGLDADTLSTENSFHLLTIPARQTTAHIKLLMARTELGSLRRWAAQSPLPSPLDSLTSGGPAQWNSELTTTLELGDEDGPFAIDVLTLPTNNPWRSRLRASGLDFMPDGKRMVVCCCDGDVWMVEGLGRGSRSLRWRRIASGLFQPLGLKVLDGQIYVGCRDQIVRLVDLNGDGEADFYESFNNDHQVTPHFHEFAMGLQADGDGSLYYAKSARHALGPLVPQHGTLLQVSPDGKTTEILANGFRAANGVCLNPDGTFFVTDQEGHWTPMNRVNWVVRGGFYGNMYSYGAPSDSGDGAMKRPLCWADKRLDRSPAELLWIDSDQWGPFNGSLLSLSYGYGKVYIVPHERVGGVRQGGMCRLPMSQFPTGVMRARFHPQDGQMYACGMHAWGSNQTDRPGGVYRIRYTGRAAHVPVVLQAHRAGMRITFSERLDPVWAANSDNYLIEAWTLKRTANYGSEHHDQRILDVADVELSDDCVTVDLKIPKISPTWCMQIGYRLKGSDGQVFNGVIQNTIHELGER